MKSDVVSKKVSNRLPFYLDYLKSLPESVENISATTIAKALALGEVQVRKDLAKVSHSGRQRTGRNRMQLIQEIEACLKYTGMIIIGTGRWGQALLKYDGFEKAGLNVMAGFDPFPMEYYTENGKPIYHLSQLELFCKRYDVRIGVITVDSEEISQMVCDRLVACGVNTIWNLTRSQLEVPKHVVVQNKKFSGHVPSLLN